MTDRVAEETSERGLFFGHPRGLLVLAATELWERISFYGMQTLLVLYMVDELLRPGHVEKIVGFPGFRGGLEHLTGPLSTQALASQIFGLYVGLVALTPVLGGFLGDRLLGRRRSITLGALLMTAGHFCMAFDQSFLLALLLLIVGAGFLRGNIIPQFGELYSQEDRRRGIAFQIYGSMVNLGAFLAPLITGALGQAFGWRIGFGFAGFGMLLGLVIYLSGQGVLPADRPRSGRVKAPPLDPAERRTVGFLMALAPLVALFWVAQSQIWNTYNLWVRDHVQLKIGSFTVPVPWLQSLDGLAPFVLLPPVFLFWGWQAKRRAEPDEVGKIAIGCFIFSASTFWLAGAQFITDGAGKTPLIWPVVFHFASNLGWLYTVPSINALASRVAPRAVNATMISFLTLAVTLGSFVSGRLGGLYETLPPSQFWALHAAAVGLGGVLVLIWGVFFARRAGGISFNPGEGGPQG